MSQQQMVPVTEFTYPQHIAYAHFRTTAQEHVQNLLDIGALKNLSAIGLLRDFTAAYFMDHNAQVVYVARGIFNPNDQWKRNSGRDINEALPPIGVERNGSEKNVNMLMAKFGITREEAVERLKKIRYVRKMNVAQFNRGDGRKYSRQALDILMALPTHEERLEMVLANPRIYGVMNLNAFITAQLENAFFGVKETSVELRQGLLNFYKDNLKLFDIKVGVIKATIENYFVGQDLYLSSPDRIHEAILQGEAIHAEIGFGEVTPVPAAQPAEAAA